jgi:hypothetical protein
MRWPYNLTPMYRQEPGCIHRDTKLVLLVLVAHVLVFGLAIYFLI